MSKNPTVVGHPVDVATGAVYTSSLDVSLPGNMKLTWERKYHSGTLSAESGPLGPGWTTRYFAALSREDGGFRFRTPEGTEEFLEDPLDSVARGSVLRDLAGFQEIAR